MPAVEADHWDEAMAAAERYPDPVPQKLVTFYRLLDPGAASAPEIAAFLKANPDWPFERLLRERLDKALATETDDSIALPLCRAGFATSGKSLLRCAEAERDQGATAAASRDARRAWITGGFSPGDRAAFLADWGGALTPADQWARFAELAARGAGGLTEELPLLAPDDQAAGAAWIGLLQNAPNAWTAFAALPASQRRRPGLFLAALWWLERAMGLNRAIALWTADGEAAANAASPELRSALWRVRSALAFDLIRSGRASDAYGLVTAPAPISRRDALDRDFLAGFIALQWLKDPTAANRFFTDLAHASPAAITQGRAHYWLGRAAAAAGDPGQAKAEYAAAARWPTTYYGQLAALALGETNAELDRRIRALRDPGWTGRQALDFAGREVTRAAGFLVAWGVPRRARPFLARLAELAPDPAVRSLTARLALGFGLPGEAVMASRIAGSYGTTLAQSGWPMPFEAPADSIDPAVTLGIIREESSFDAGAASPAGALGLMQLTPGTARAMAQSLGERFALAALATDARQNMVLGTAYFRTLLDRFGGTLPLAIAAYNAGPSNVSDWLAENGDPRHGGPNMVTWIELIPFGETRNYVERVIESIAVYQAKLHDDRSYPLALWRGQQSD